jgi:hypothetical protein
MRDHALFSGPQNQYGSYTSYNQPRHQILGLQSGYSAHQTFSGQSHCDLNLRPTDLKFSRGNTINSTHNVLTHKIVGL